ncbi:hypothetical protein [Veillonella sp. 3310]|uniref:hypothetical protein n=1 Tax=Veillonella sp. 3310 TaxID=2490956 RepID=UPI000FD65F62|nr:hypothetical protein [Veillonella sp. 3310]
MNDLENKELKKTEIIVKLSYEPNWPTRIIFIRLIITIVSALIIFTDISEGTSFFRSLFIFCSSILFATIGISSFGWKQKLHNVIHFVLYMYITIAALGLFNLLQVMTVDGKGYVYFNPMGPMPLIHVSTNVLFYILVVVIILLSCIQYVNSYEPDVRNLEKEEAR